MKKGDENALPGSLITSFRYKKRPDGSVDKSKVICNVCTKEFAYHRSASTLKYHISAKHPGVNPQVGPRPSTSSDTSFSCQPHRQTTLEQTLKRKLSKSACDQLSNSLAKWIAVSCRPVSVIEDRGLAEVLQIASSDVTYNLPSRTTIMSKIQLLYDTEKKTKGDVLVGAEHIALTGDHWTSVSNHNYLGVTAHIIDCEWKLQSFALAMLKTESRHYADACAQQFLSVAEAWGVQSKITTVGTDSARNMIAAARKLPYEHMPCKHKLTMLTTSEWDKLQRLKTILEPCRYVTELLGGETYVSCSVVLPALCHLYRTMEVSDEDPAYIGTFKTAFKKDLSERQANLNNGWLNIASALDPRFKDLRCLKKGDREAVWTSLQALLDNKPSTAAPESVEEPLKKRSLLLFASDTDSDDDMVEPSRALNHYKAEPTIGMEECPLQWWKTHAGAHQQLSVLARKYLAAPASSVPCERLFSLAGNIVQKRRAALSSENVERLVCVSDWLKEK
ncbi:unnamed protein product [Menidia menidia]|uniref:(Atlantic silverside) hypothetical protein n=1 Tax=Menidia menidia TaxID=238744 RepID=A0A8S4C448_9TELE|nr:unnamed protein product [Menidia menidia]